MRPPPGSSPRAWSDGPCTATVGFERPGASLVVCADNTWLPLRIEVVTLDDRPALVCQAEFAVPSDVHKEKA